MFEISYPSEPNLVAWYDTHLQDSYSGYQGAWGVHSTLPSGKVLISDMKNGLHVLKLTPDESEFCPNESIEWNGLTITDEGYYSIESSDELWVNDIQWLIANYNESLCPDCPGDLDENGSLGVSDLNIILSEFGCTSSCQSDFNGDGSNTIGDILFWLSLFGTIC